MHVREACVTRQVFLAVHLVSNPWELQDFGSTTSCQFLPILPLNPHDFWLNRHIRIRYHNSDKFRTKDNWSRHKVLPQVLRIHILDIENYYWA